MAKKNAAAVASQAAQERISSSELILTDTEKFQIRDVQRKMDRLAQQHNQLAKAYEDVRTQLSTENKVLEALISTIVDRIGVNQIYKLLDGETLEFVDRPVEARAEAAKYFGLPYEDESALATETVQ